MYRYILFRQSKPCFVDAFKGLSKIKFKKTMGVSPAVHMPKCSTIQNIRREDSKPE